MPRKINDESVVTECEKRMGKQGRGKNKYYAVQETDGKGKEEEKKEKNKVVIR